MLRLRRFRSTGARELSYGTVYLGTALSVCVMKDIDGFHTGKGRRILDENPQLRLPIRASQSLGDEISDLFMIFPHPNCVRRFSFLYPLRRSLLLLAFVQIMRARAFCLTFPLRLPSCSTVDEAPLKSRLVCACRRGRVEQGHTAWAEVRLGQLTGDDGSCSVQKYPSYRTVYIPLDLAGELRQNIFCFTCAPLLVLFYNGNSVSFISQGQSSHSPLWGPWEACFEAKRMTVVLLILTSKATTELALLGNWTDRACHCSIHPLY